MEFSSEFVPLALADLRREAAFMKAEGWRFVQTHAVNTEDGVDLYYSFMNDGFLRNYHIAGVKPEDEVPSITDLFLAAFVFENEARELFGVNMGSIAIDFQGTMYAPAQNEPMTFMSPEQKAAIDKARKAAAAKAAKEAKAAKASGDADAAGEKPAAASADASSDDIEAAEKPGRGRRFVMTPELQARLDAKMPSLSPEKVAKVEAALKARAAEADPAPLFTEEARVDARDAGRDLATASPAQKAATASFAQDVETEQGTLSQLPVDKELESALEAMDPARADSVRTALQGSASPSVADENNAAGVDQPLTELYADEEMEALLASMDDEKAAKVLEAFAREGGR